MAVIREVIMRDGQLVCKLGDRNGRPPQTDPAEADAGGSVGEAATDGDVAVDNKRPDGSRATGEEDVRDSRPNAGIAKVIFHEDADGLRDFFATVMSQRHTFKVATQRCHSLMRALCGNDSPVQGEVLCGDALLLYARDFAGQYVRLGFFPSLLVVTDVLVTSRAVYDVLYGMENLIYEMLQEWGEPLSREITRQEIHRGMLSATDIMTYAEGRPDDQIWLSYSYKVHAARHHPAHDISYDPHDPFVLELTHDINRFLMYCDDVVTPHALSVRVAPKVVESIGNNGWDRLAWGYRRRCGLLLSKLDGEGTTRMAYAFGTDVSGEVLDHITSISHIGSISCKQLNMICGELAREALSETKDGRLFRFLSSTCPGTAGYKMALLSLVDGAETLRCLMSDIGMSWDEALESSNLEDICRCLGRGTDTGDTLRRILRNPEMIRRCSQILRQGGTWGYDGSHDGVSVGVDTVMRRCEDILCQAGMRVESMSYRYSHNLATFSPLSSALSQHHEDVPHGEFLTQMREEGLPVTDAMLAACEASMLHHGFCHTKYALSESTDEVSRCLSVERLTTCLVPLRHRRFFRVLKDLRFYWLMYSTPTSLIQELIDELSDDTDIRERLGQAWVDGIRKDIPWYVDAAYAMPDADSGDALLLRCNGLSFPSVGGMPERPEARYYEDFRFLREKARAFAVRRKEEITRRNYELWCEAWEEEGRRLNEAFRSGNYKLIMSHR